MRKGLLLALAFWLAATPAAADPDVIRFSTPPTQPPEVTLRNYQPLADYLSQATGKRVVVEPAKYFIEYSRRMTAGEYDLLFDGPHFAGYRIDHMGHRALAKIPGDLRFVAVTRADAPIHDIGDFVARRVCGPGSPNLATLTFLDQFPNPARQPTMVRAASFGDALACLRDGRAEGAVLRDRFWARQDADDLRAVPIVTAALPERVFTAGPGLDQATRAAVRAALINPQGNELARQVLAAIGGGEFGFVAAEDNEYRGLGRLLKDVWGFQEEQ